MNYDAIKNFLDEEGRLVKYPSKHRLKLISMCYIGEKFQLDVIYTEKQVNTTIDNWHTFGDICLIRRELIERNVLCRHNNGSGYWVNPNRPQEVL